MEKISEEKGTEPWLEVKLWGTRGSCPAPYKDRMVYGGNTSCMAVRWKEGCAVFDGGTGIAAFGKSLEQEVKQGQRNRDVRIDVFVTHLHLDHVAGIPLLPCLFWKEAKVHFYGPAGEERSFRQRLSGVLGPPYWPVAVDQVPASVLWHDADEKARWQLPGQVQVRAMRSNHPDGGFVYRLDYKGESVVYGLDCELGEETETASEGEEKGIWQRYREFAENCSLLAFDGPYTKDNYGAYKGFGHSYWQQGLTMAQSCNAGRLCICHHDWGQTDEQMAEKERELQMMAGEWGRPAEFAREGAVIFLGSRG